MEAVFESTPKKEGGLKERDLRAFGPALVADLEALLPQCRVELERGSAAPVAVPGRESVFDLPLELQGRVIGRVRGFLRPGENAPAGPVLGLLPELLRQGLEKMRLRKSRLVDLETGLLNRDYFSHRLIGELEKAGRRQEGPRALSLSEGSGSPRLILALAELREPEVSLGRFRALAGAFRASLPGCRVARLSEDRLGLLFRARPDRVRAGLESGVENFLARYPESGTVVAWVGYVPESGGGGETGDPIRQASEQLREKAQTALFYARTRREPALVIGFEDLIRDCGQIVQLLPQDRAVINLGRQMGASSGQVFLVKGGRAHREPEYKGEVAIYETAENYSLAHIVSQTRARRIVAGDQLAFSRRQWEDSSRMRVAEAGRGMHIVDRERLLTLLKAENPDRPLALILARLDGYEKLVSLLSPEEVAKKEAYLWRRIRQVLPAEVFAGLWRPGVLALVWPGGEAANALGPIHRLAGELSEAGPVSFGLTFWPSKVLSDFEALLDDSPKTLDEASFTGPGQVTVFGPLTLNISGDQLFEGGDWTGALKEYERGLVLGPDHLNLLNSQGVCHGRLGDFAAALAAFDRIIALEPGNMMAHYNRGYTYLLAGRLEEAAEALSRAAELTPDNFESLFHLGKTSLELGRLDQALAALKRAGELHDRRPAVFRILGEALLLAQDPVAALAAFKQAVKADPEDAYSLSALGALFMEKGGDHEVAKSLFRKSVELDPTNSLYRQRLGRLLFTLGEFQEAEHHLKTALEYGSRAPEVHYHLGRLAEELGRSEEAAAHFEAASNKGAPFKTGLE